MIHFLSALTQNNQGPDEVSINELSLFTGAFPYCQPAHMLLAIALKKYDKDPDKHNEQKALAYAPDVQVFWDHLRKTQTSVQQKTTIREADIMADKSYLGNMLSFLDGINVVDEQSPVVVPSATEAIEQGLSEKQQMQQHIIDRFLQSEPRMSPVNKEEAVVQPTANEDGTEPVGPQSEIISETLADILYKQGKTSKALGIYEKLCLKYPEKSSYFAKKINDLKNTLGQQITD